jgi:hypothetical protein
MASLGSFAAAVFNLPSRRQLFVAYVLAGIAAGAISLAFGQSKNFDVFRQATHDLLRGDDLYVLRAADYFKYSPTFALLFAPFASGPAWLMAPLWSLANFAVAFVGIDRTVEHDRDKRVALLVALLGIAVTTDGDQSNLLVGGALLVALRMLERRRVATAMVLVVFAGFVKLFPFAFAALALLYPTRARSALALAAATVVLAALPLLVVSPDGLAREYASWHALVARDHASEGWSAMSFLHATFGVSWSALRVQLAGAVVQAIPIALALRFGADAAWRRTLACSLLAFAVLFNHRAEYASYVLSAMALAIWCATSPPSRWRTALVAIALVVPGPFFARPDPSVSGVFTVLAAHRLFHPLRVAPLAVAWLAMLRDLLRPFIELEVKLRLRPLAARRFDAS